MRSSNSSSFTSRSATVLILTREPGASRAACNPSSVCASLPPRVMARKRSGSSVSRLTLIRRTPGRRQTPPAWRASWLPLVVSVSSSSPSRRRSPGPSVCDQPHHVAPHQRLAAGDAQLARAEPDEDAAEPLQLLEGQKLLARQEGHVLLHAIDAAEVAAVRDRNAQIGDRAAEGSISGRGEGGREKVPSIVHQFQRYDPGVDQHLAGILEIHRDPVADHRLHLANSPFRAGRMTDAGAGLDEQKRAGLAMIGA